MFMAWLSYQGVEGDGEGVTDKEAAMFVATKEGYLDGELAHVQLCSWW